ncbi:MAG: NACHT domain-containing NTPase [Calothrix sp. MO_167.B42]|nr:NACHT domain-containing NTPase [Calothrix sp. MO_167.B42]
MGRSLKASLTGIREAKLAFQRKGWTQDYLAGASRCSRQIVINFFARRAVEKRIFQAICDELGLEWGDIAEAEIENLKNNLPSTIDELVQIGRDTIYENVLKRYGTMRILDMTQPIGLEAIYTQVNILEKITGRRRMELSEFLQRVSPDNFDRINLRNVDEESVPGIDAVNKYSKLMILGKPGAGKTTFLKNLVIQCISGTFQANRIPILISLKDFAEAPDNPHLLDYLNQMLSSYGLASNLKIKSHIFESIANWNQLLVEQLLNHDRLLILLDGLDEVRESDNSRVLKEIRDLTNRFDKNKFVITCRIAAREYTFEQFTEVEIADFDNEQIHIFVGKWFCAKDELVKGERFSQKLREEPPIKELATSPLLLTLLCLVFEESGNFPSNRADLYREGLDVLLKKWDAKRNIERDQIYKKLSLRRKEDLLSQVALETFEQGDYFFKQKVVEGHIIRYIKNLPGANTDLDLLQLDSEAILKSVEAQHGLLIERARGIYSFSHLTFHEYFTARMIKERPSKHSLEELSSHITEKRWREVILLSVGMLENANELLQLIKYKIDCLLVKDDKLKQFLLWVNKKTCALETPYKQAAVRAFYFVRALSRHYNLDNNRTIDFALVHDLEPALIYDLELDLAINLALALSLAANIELSRARAYNIASTVGLNHSITLVSNLQNIGKKKNSNLKKTVSFVLDIKYNSDHVIAFAIVVGCIIDTARFNDVERILEKKPELIPILQKLEKGIEDLKKTNWRDSKRKPTQEQKVSKLEGLELEKLKVKMLEAGDFEDWRFNTLQQQFLLSYYDSTRLLVECLNGDCYISRDVRMKIENEMLLLTATK